MDMDIQNNSFLSIDQLANQYLNSSRKTVKAAQENLVSFQEILQNKSQEQNVSGTQDLKFSKHAAERFHCLFDADAFGHFTYFGWRQETNLA